MLLTSCRVDSVVTLDVEPNGSGTLAIVTTADTRYMVLPEQPPNTLGWPLERLAELVTRDGMIGVARL